MANDDVPVLIVGGSLVGLSTAVFVGLGDVAADVPPSAKPALVVAA